MRAGYGLGLYAPRELILARMSGFGPGACDQMRVQTTPQALALNSANHSVAWTFPVPYGKGGTAAFLGACTEVGAGTPPAMNFALVQLGADGNPGTTPITPLNSRDPETWDPTGTGFRWVALTDQGAGKPAPVLTPGSYYCLRLWPATAPDAGNYCYAYRPRTVVTTRELPRWTQTTTTNLNNFGGASDHFGLLAVQLTDGTTFGLPADVNITAPGSPAVPAFPVSGAFGPTAAVRKAGAKFLCPITMEVDGFWGTLWPSTNNVAYALQLADSDGSTILYSEQFDDSDMLAPGASACESSEIPFATPWILQAGHTYYLWLADIGGGGNGYQIVRYALPDAASISAFEGAENWQFAQLNDDDSITLDATKVPWMGFRVRRIFA